ncbi:MAG: hypothetical protein AB9903_09480 [Vulcanimicrobiota bacterium]
MTGNRISLILALMAIMMLNASSYASASGDEKLVYELNYGGKHLAPITGSAEPVKIMVKTFKDMRDDKSIAGRSATYTIFHAKGRYEKDDCKIDMEKFVTESVMKDLKTLGFEPVLLQADVAGAASQEGKVIEQEGQKSPDEAPIEPEKDTQKTITTEKIVSADCNDCAITVEGEIQHFYGEVVTNTWTWPFQNKTAKGKVILVFRFIDSKDGKIIIESKGEAESRVAGGPDKVNRELNNAFEKAMSKLFSKEVLEALAERGKAGK